MMPHILCNDSIKVQCGSLQERSLGGSRYRTCAEKIFWELQAELRNVKYFTWSKSFILKKWSITTNLAPEGYFQRANAEFISYSAGFRQNFILVDFTPKTTWFCKSGCFPTLFVLGFYFLHQYMSAISVTFFNSGCRFDTFFVRQQLRHMVIDCCFLKFAVSQDLVLCRVWQTLSRVIMTMTMPKLI